MAANGTNKSTRIPILVGGVLVAWLALNLWSLTHYPAPSCDESIYSAAAHTWFRTGTLAPTYYYNDPAINPAIAFGRSYIALLGVPLLIPANPLILSRLFGLLGAALAGLSIFALGRRLFTRPVGLWAGALVLFDWAVFAQSHSSRPDVWLAAASVAVLLLLMHLTEHPTAPLAALTGFAAALLVDVHLNGMHFALALGLLAVWLLAIEKKRWGMIIWFGVGALLGVGYWLAVHLLPDPELALSQYRVITVGENRAFWQMPVMFHIRSLLGFLRENFIQSMSGLSILSALFYLFGIGTAIARRDDHAHHARVLLAFILISLISFSIVNVLKPNYYALLWRVPLTLLAVSGVFWLLDHAADAIPRRLRALPLHSILLALVLLVYAAGNLYLTVKFYPTDYAGVAADLRDLVPPGASVMADEPLWFALYDRDMVVGTYLLWASEYVNEQGTAPLSTYYAEVDPDYLVLDQYLNCSTAETRPHAFLRDYAESSCTAVGTVTSPWLDTSTVYYCGE